MFPPIIPSNGSEQPPDMNDIVAAQGDMLYEIVNFLADADAQRVTEQELAQEKISRVLHNHASKCTTRNHRINALPIVSTFAQHNFARLNEQDVMIQTLMNAINAGLLKAPIRIGSPTIPEEIRVDEGSDFVHEDDQLVQAVQPSLVERPLPVVGSPPTIPPSMMPPIVVGGLPNQPPIPIAPVVPILGQYSPNEVMYPPEGARTNDHKKTHPPAQRSQNRTRLGGKGELSTQEAQTPRQEAGCRVGVPSNAANIAVYMVPWLENDTSVAGVDSECGRKLIEDAWGQKEPASSVVDALAHDNWTDLLFATRASVKRDLPEPVEDTEWLRRGLIQ